MYFVDYIVIVIYVWLEVDYWFFGILYSKDRVVGFFLVFLFGNGYLVVCLWYGVVKFVIFGKKEFWYFRWFNFVRLFDILRCVFFYVGY